MELAKKVFVFIALAVSGLALLLNVISLAIPMWLYSSFGEAWSSSGLWQGCGDDGRGSSKCISFEDVPNVTIPTYLKLTRAFMILGMLFMVAAAACGVLKLFVLKDQDRLPKLAGASAILAGILILNAVIVYGAKTTEQSKLVGISPPFHAGFGLAVVAAVMAFIAGLLYFIAANKNQI